MAKAVKDYKKIAEGVLASVGGAENVASVSHCMTRLRVKVKDAGKVKVEEGKKIPGVLNLIVQNGEYQYVIGQDVPSLHEEFTKLGDFESGGAVEDDEALKADTQAKKGRVLNKAMTFVGGTFSPIIPVLVAGGLTGAVLTLLTTFFMASIRRPSTSCRSSSASP